MFCKRNRTILRGVQKKQGAFFLQFQVEKLDYSAVIGRETSAVLLIAIHFTKP